MNDVIKDFELMRDNAELRALQSYSLDNELSDKQFIRFKELALRKLGGDL